MIDLFLVPGSFKVYLVSVCEATVLIIIFTITIRLHGNCVWITSKLPLCCAGSARLLIKATEHVFIHDPRVAYT